MKSSQTIKVAARLNSRIRKLLDAATSLCRVPVILHDYLAQTRLPIRLSWHTAASCLHHKRLDQNLSCAQHCGAGGDIDTWIGQAPDGAIYTCPHGLIKIAIPLQSRGLLAGILHAGPIPPAINRKQAEEMRLLLLAVAHEIEHVCAPFAVPADSTDRAHIILKYIDSLQGEEARIEELAVLLNLSPSRARHVIRETFGKPLRTLSREIRLQRAASLLALGEMPLVTIAQRTGFCDQSHFSKAFTAHFKQSPLRYRQHHRGDG